MNKLSNVLRLAKKHNLDTDVQYSVFPYPQGKNVSIGFELDNSYDPYLDGTVPHGEDWFDFVKDDSKKDQMSSLINSILVGLDEDDPLVNVHGKWCSGNFIITHVVSVTGESHTIYATDDLEIICPDNTYLVDEFSYYPATINLSNRSDTVDKVKSHSDIIATDNPIQDFFKFDDWKNEETMWIAKTSPIDVDLSFVTNSNTLKAAHEATITDGDKGKAVVKFLDMLPLENLMRADGITYMEINKLPQDSHHTPHFIRYISTEVSKLELYRQGLINYGLKEEDILKKLQTRIREWWLRWIDKS